MNYENKLDIIKYFNSKTSVPLFLIRKYKSDSYSQHKKTNISHDDLVEKIEKQEYLEYITINNVHASDNLVMIGVQKNLKEIIANERKRELSQQEFVEKTNEHLKELREFTNNFFEMYKHDKNGFERKYKLFLYQLSYDEAKENKYGLSIVSDLFLELMNNKYIQEEFVKAYIEKDWTKEDFVSLSNMFINPYHLAGILNNKNYLEFSEKYLLNLKKLKVDINDVENSKNDNLLLGVGLRYLLYKDMYGSINIQRFQFDYTECVDYIETINDQDRDLNVLALVEMSKIKSLKTIKILRKHLTISGLIQKNRKERRVGSAEEYVDILIDNREYENIVFDTSIKLTSQKQILKALDELNCILINETNFKISLKHEYVINNHNNYRFTFKVDKRCVGKKDNLAIYLQDLLMEVFSLDTKNAYNQIKQHEINAPTVIKLLKYLNNNLEKNKDEIVEHKEKYKM